MSAEIVQGHEGRLFTFFLVTFVLSWSSWGAAIVAPEFETPLRILGTFGPTLAALALLAVSAEGLRPTLRRLLIWRIPFWIYVYVFGLTLVGCVVALWLARAVTGGGDVLPLGMPIHAPVFVFAYVLLFSVAGEELGWRGYVLPRFLTRYGPVQASVLLGVVWAIWHAPLFVMQSDFHADIPFLLFAVQVVASSLIYTHLHLVSNGSLLIPHLFHAAFNTTVGLMPILPVARDGDGTAFAIGVGLLSVVAIPTAVQLSRRSLRFGA